MVTDKAGLGGNLDIDCDAGRSDPRPRIDMEHGLDLMSYREAMDGEVRETH